MQEIGRGAEAVLFKAESRVVKDRPVKGYRLPVIDTSLRKYRTRREARILKRLSDAGLPVPVLLTSDETNMRIEMSFLEGPKVRDVLDSDLSLARSMGSLIGRMHALDVIHADLTTSNMVLVAGAVNLIDFGLSFVSDKIEDKAVDLHVLDRALESKHHGLYPEVFDAVLEGYATSYPSAEEVIKRLDVVKSRGRNKK